MVVANGAVFDVEGRGRDVVEPFNLGNASGDMEVSGGTVSIHNCLYAFAKWGKVLRFSGKNCTWAGYPFYNYENVSDSHAASEYRNSLMFNKLEFKDDPSIAFSTNVVVLTLNGAESVSSARSTSIRCGATAANTPERWADTTGWTS